jgi:hypothetical protein
MKYYPVSFNAALARRNNVSPVGDLAADMFTYFSVLRGRAREEEK